MILQSFRRGEAILSNFSILGFFLHAYVPRVDAHSDWRNNMLWRLEIEKRGLLVGRRHMFGRIHKNIFPL